MCLILCWVFSLGTHLIFYFYFFFTIGNAYKWYNIQEYKWVQSKRYLKLFLGTYKTCFLPSSCLWSRSRDKTSNRKSKALPQGLCASCSCFPEHSTPAYVHGSPLPFRSLLGGHLLSEVSLVVLSEFFTCPLHSPPCCTVLSSSYPHLMYYQMYIVNVNVWCILCLFATYPPQI